MYAGRTGSIDRDIGGFVWARYAGWRRGASIQRSYHSVPLVPCRVAELSMVEMVEGLGLGEPLPPLRRRRGVDP